MLKIYLEGNSVLIFEKDGRKVGISLKPNVFFEGDVVIINFEGNNRYNRREKFTNISVKETVYSSAAETSAAINALCVGFNLGGGTSETTSLLATQPHLWEEGVEIDFGDGSFGFSKRGVIDTNSSTIVQTAIFNSSVATIVDIISCGGIVRASGDNSMALGQYIGSSMYSNLQPTGANGLWLISANSMRAGGYPYFVWVRYTKR